MRDGGVDEKLENDEWDLFDQDLDLLHELLKFELKNVRLFGFKNFLKNPEVVIAEQGLEVESGKGF